MSIYLIRNKLRGIGKKYLNREMAMCDTYWKHDVYFYLLKIRAAMFCYNCGFNINLADKFCSSCGKGKFSPLYNHSSGRGDVLGLFARVNSFYSLW